MAEVKKRSFTAQQCDTCTTIYTLNIEHDPGMECSPVYGSYAQAKPLITLDVP